MASLESGLWSIFIIFLIIVISALPLHLAVSFFGGRSSILKAFLVMIITAILTLIITEIFPFGNIVAFIILIWVYREMFRLKWIKAFLVWILQIVFIFVLAFILSLFGLGAAMTNYFIF